MAYDSTLVVYTGINRPNIPITAGQNLQTILQNIDGKLGSIVAPNYTSYDLACITQIDGSSHPTNAQNFAEGISKIVCDNATIVDTFIDTTYASDQAVITGSINAIKQPGLTYSAFSITNADSLTTVFTKMFAGFTAYNTALNPSTANWASLSITAPTTVTNGFNSLITYIGTMNSTIAGKQASLGTFDNSANCLAGGATDNALTTINLLRTKVCSLPTFDADDITTSCMTSQTDLQDWMQELVNTMDGVLENYVSRANTGIVLTTGSSCNGATISIDPTYTGFRKVGVSSVDSTYGYLQDKLIAGVGVQLSQVTDAGITKIQITNTSPNVGKVLVNQYDVTSGYLVDKISTSVTGWGLSLSVRNDSSNNRVILTPEVADADLLASMVLDTVMNNPSLIDKFKQIMDSTTDDSGDAHVATGLNVIIK